MFCLGSFINSNEILVIIVLLIMHIPMTYFGIVDHFAPVSGEGISLEEKVHSAIEKHAHKKGSEDKKT